MRAESRQPTRAAGPTHGATAAAVVRFPLGVAPDRRHLVDEDGVPFLLQGDLPWSILVSATDDDARRYLDTRATQGFNALVVNLVEHVFAPDPPRNLHGELPFEDAGDLTRPNEAYFRRADRLLAMAAERGMLVLLNPLYLGYRAPAYPGFGGRPEGWYDEALGAGPDGCQAFGRYLGERYRMAGNLLWVMSGDRCPGEALPHVRALVRGIRETDDPRRLFTAHVHPGCRPLESYPDDPWLTVNQVYSYDIVHRACRDAYQWEPAHPFFLFELTYEGEHNASELQVRRQAWWPMLMGAFGQCLGNSPVWRFGPGWEMALDSSGARAMIRWRAILGSIPWWTLVPDLSHHLIVGGEGEHNGLDLAAAAMAPDGKLALVYLPVAREITLDLAVLSGRLVGRWLDPIDDRASDEVAFTAAGTWAFRPPWGHDAVLMLRAVD